MNRPAEARDGLASLGQLFTQVVSTLPPSLPFAGAELLLIDGQDAVRGFAIRPDSPGTPLESAARRADHSRRLWPPDLDGPHVVRDASVELDPAFTADQRLLASGARSLLTVPLGARARPLGLLVLTAPHAEAFAAGHAASVAPLAALLSVAAERERLWSLEQDRQRRRSRLDALLPALAEALDVRQVFLGLSRLIQEVVPHDILAFALLSPDRGGVTVQAATEAGLREMPEYRFSNEQEALDANWKYLLAYDLVPIEDGVLRVRISPPQAAEPVEVVVRPGLAWTRFVTTAGVRSTLRVPILAKERPVGGVAFLSRRPDTYDQEDGALAARIADHLALALAHQELAEEERRIAQAEERAAMLEERVVTLSREVERFGPHRALGQSSAWKQVLADATQVAATDTTVLVTGESGTGKEVVARFLHRGSPRARGPFVAINCAALPEQLLESELFGHERGAFTGALNARPGKIEQAAGGVLFLDEVGEMSPAVQAKFLRVLQEREFQRLGGSRTLQADIRVVAATNRDPRRAMESGAFREDLYYRLSVFEIQLPPLRERREDVLVLAEAFLEQIGESVGRPAAGISEDARDLLLSHSWPGNVRELKNAIERAVILCQGGLIAREHLPVSVAAPSRAPGPAEPDQDPAATAPPPGLAGGALKLETVERELLVKALAQASDNKSEAARLLGLSRGQLYSLLRRHGLTSARR